MNNNSNKKMRFLLILAPILWGSAVVVSKDALDSLPAFWLLAYRFTGCFIVIAIIMWKKIRKIDLSYIWRGSLMGFFLYATYAFQIMSLERITPGTTAFLCGIYCVIVPFLYWLVDKKKPDRYNIIAGVVCLTGIGFISLNGSLTGEIGVIFGLIAGICFAWTIVVVGKFTRGKDVFALTVVQFGAFSIFAWITAFITTPMPESIIPSEAIFQLGYLIIFPSVLGFLIQNYSQRFTPTSMAAIFFSLEAPFGAIFSIMFGMDHPTPRMLIGFTLIFIGIICSETKLGFIKRKQLDKL